MASKGKSSLTPEQNALLARAIEQLRETLKTDKAVAAAVGADTSTINKVRHGEQGGSMLLAQGIAAALGRDVGDVLGLPRAPDPCAIGARPEFPARLAEARAAYAGPDVPPEWAWERAALVQYPSSRPLTARAVYLAARGCEELGRDT